MTAELRDLRHCPGGLLLVPDHTAEVGPTVAQMGELGAGFTPPPSRTVTGLGTPTCYACRSAMSSLCESQQSLQGLAGDVP